LDGLQVELDSVLAELFGVDLCPRILLLLLVELHRLELYWRRSLLKGRSEVDVLRYDSSVEKADHPLVDVFFGNRWWVLKVVLVFDVFLELGISDVSLSHDVA